VVISKRVAWFLIAFGVWSWIIWPTFLKNIWKDDRSWDDGMTAFFAVHLVLVIVSLVLGTIIGVLGIRALRQQRSGVSFTGGKAPVTSKTY
jgi:ABC-type polysaccharide/polyol phosphate export permease